MLSILEISHENIAYWLNLFIFQKTRVYFFAEKGEKLSRWCFFNLSCNQHHLYYFWMVKFAHIFFCYFIHYFAPFWQRFLIFDFYQKHAHIYNDLAPMFRYVLKKFISFDHNFLFELRFSVISLYFKSFFNFLNRNSHFLCIVHFLFEFEINSRNIDKAGDNWYTLELLCEIIFDKLVKNIGDRMRMIQNLAKIFFITNTKEKESIDGQIRKGLIIKIFPVVFVAEQRSDVDAIGRVLQIYF